MTYRYSPTSEKPRLSLSQSEQYGSSVVTPGAISISDDIEEQVCPAVITEFLNKMHWNVVCQHPDTQEPLFTKQDMGMRPIVSPDKEVDLTESMHFRWYEAVAYEHAKMMSIGLGE